MVYVPPFKIKALNKLGNKRMTKETIIQAKADELIQLVLEEVGKPPFDYGTLSKATSRIAAVMSAFKPYSTYGLIGEEEAFATDVAVAVAAEKETPTWEVPAATVVVTENPVAAVVTETPTTQKRTRRSKEQIAADEAAAKARVVEEPVVEEPVVEEPVVEEPVVEAPVVAAPVVAAPVVAAPVVAATAKSAGDKFLLDFPNLVVLTKAEEPQKLISDHKAPLEVVQSYAKRPKLAQLERGNSHGNSLAKAAIRSLGGARISEVAPANWGKLIDLFVTITDASVPDIELESTDDAGYDRLLKAITIVASQDVGDEEL